jgi:DNA-binding IclR family transcriptional regulator
MAQGSQTADRAIEVLFHAVSSEEPVGLAELGRLSGLNKAATYRLVQSLLGHSLLVREPHGRRFVAGPGLIALSAMVMRKVDIRVAARPVMERVAAATGETVSLHVRYQHRRICIDTLESKHPIRRVVPLGENLPLYAGPTGKSILAHLAPDDLAAELEIAADAGEDIERITDQLQLCRDQGFLALVGDRTPDVGGLCIPVFDAVAIAGALTVSGPAERFSSDAIDEVAQEVRDECTALSAALGHVEPALVLT